MSSSAKKIGQGLPDHRDGQGEPVDPAVAEEGGEDAERDGNDEREGEGEDSEEQRRRELSPDQPEDLRLEIQRGAEVAAHRPPQPLAVLNGQRAVEPVAAADKVDVLLSRTLTGNGRRDVAG